ncbi:hypothetical protein Y1Q_0016999 [Alligator mississippiensis]|uniref:Uncharacterized protein n=1 Tax=Alligator mississippiensis TaxID=8496 RepID=A0A151N3I3_ALLMI|nr:hypothetical protein Y1Q_0016999 [Alligator mississippiensis]
MNITSSSKKTNTTKRSACKSICSWKCHLEHWYLYTTYNFGSMFLAMELLGHNHHHYFVKHCETSWDF